MCIRDRFEDGVGIVRSFVDDWEEAERTGLVARAADTLQTANLDVRYLVGQATRDFLTPLVARGLLTSHFEPLFVDNHFFGGNVDVTGLLCGCDMAAAIRAAEATRTAAAALNAHDTLPSPSALYLIPRVVFNDDAVTLDGMTLEDMGKRSGARVAVVSCNATDYLSEIIDLAGR